MTRERPPSLIEIAVAEQERRQAAAEAAPVAPAVIHHLFHRFDVAGVRVIKGRPSMYCRPRGDYSVFELRSGTGKPAETTCQACIDAYETQPQLVRTTDLLEVVRLLQAVARRHARVGAADPVARQLHDLEQRLARPRRIAQPPPLPLAMEKTCGKCSGAVSADDDCQRCYPR